MKRVRSRRFNLFVDVKCGDGIDAGNLGPVLQPRLYQVLGWVDSGEKFLTQVVTGSPDPIWRLIYKMELTEHEIFGYLNLEVLRIGSKEDPGTSNGVVVVGMARIPIPLPNTKIGGRYGLMRPEGGGYVPDGHITVELKLSRAGAGDY